MSTDAQIAANLANAQNSTGPRTGDGKAVSSLNALKHGLTAKTVLLPGEDPSEYEVLAAGMLKDFQPLNTTEAALTQELIDLQWRLRRVSCIEARILSADVPDMKAFSNMSVHAARVKRQFSATLKELQEMQRSNSKIREKQLKEAATVHQADVLLERPSTLDTFGFDFTIEEIEQWLDRKEALDDAATALDDADFAYED